MSGEREQETFRTERKDRDIPYSQVQGIKVAIGNKNMESPNKTNYLL